MKINIAYGKDLNDNMLKQLQYMEADACTYYESMDSDENEIIVGAIPSETFKQFKRRTSNTLFFIRTIKNKLIGMACLSNIKKKYKMFTYSIC